MKESTKEASKAAPVLEAAETTYQNNINTNEWVVDTDRIRQSRFKHFWPSITQA